MENPNAKSVKKVYAKGYSEAGANMVKRALKAFVPNSGSAIEDINPNNSTLRQRSRMLYMSSPVATSAINTNRTKVVGTGLTLQSTIDNDILNLSPEEVKKWQRKTEAEFSLWADKKENCDALGLNTFYSLQQLCLKAWLMSGDVFAVVKRYSPAPLNPYTLRLHIIEADRCCTPARFKTGHGFNFLTEGRVPQGEKGAGNKIYDGVEVDKNGRVVAYHIANKHPGSLSFDKTDWTRVEAYGQRTGLSNILHIMDSERPEQYRGVPYLAPVIENLLQLRRYTESELMAALVQSFFTAWIVTETEPGEMPVNQVDGVVDGDGNIIQTNLPESGGENPNEYGMDSGTVTHLLPGEDIKFGNPNIPTAGFETFVKTICKIIGAGLDIPYDVLMKEFNASYSAARAALLEAWEGFRMRRKWFVDDFCQPTYEMWLAEAVAIGRIEAPGFFDDPVIRKAWCKAKWAGPVQGHLDPKKEAEAAEIHVRNGWKTHEQVTREFGGGDWKNNVEQLGSENEMLRKAKKGGNNNE